jgi:hypothetical protein
MASGRANFSTLWAEIPAKKPAINGTVETGVALIRPNVDASSNRSPLIRGIDRNAGRRLPGICLPRTSLLVISLNGIV